MLELSKSGRCNMSKSVFYTRNVKGARGGRGDRALDWRPGGPRFESRCGNIASELWQFRLPRFASVFRRRHKSHRSLLSRVYARGSKRSQQSALEMCNLSWTPHSNLEDNSRKNTSVLAQRCAVWSIPDVYTGS